MVEGCKRSTCTKIILTGEGKSPTATAGNDRPAKSSVKPPTPVKSDHTKLQTDVASASAVPVDAAARRLPPQHQSAAAAAAASFSAAANGTITSKPATAAVHNSFGQFSSMSKATAAQVARSATGGPAAVDRKTFTQKSVGWLEFLCECLILN